MFSIFKQKNMNINETKNFWEWFEKNEEWIIDCISNNNYEFIWKIDAILKKVFPYFKKELEFQLGVNKEAKEFFFYHFGNKNLIRDSEVLKNMMPEYIAKRWNFITEK